MRSFFLMALIVLCAMPILASTPEQDMVLIVDEGDGDFSGLEQVSDEELIEIFGNVILEASSADPKYGELGPQPHTEWYNKEILKLQKKIKMIIYISSSILIVGGAATGFLVGQTITVATLASAISSNLGSVLAPVISGYALTEALIAYIQKISGSDNIVTISQSLINGISSYLAELIYNN